VKDLSPVECDPADRRVQLKHRMKYVSLGSTRQSNLRRGRGTEGFKYVTACSDKLAGQLRPQEMDGS